MNYEAVSQTEQSTSSLAQATLAGMMRNESKNCFEFFIGEKATEEVKVIFDPQQYAIYFDQLSIFLSVNLSLC